MTEQEAINVFKEFKFTPREMKAVAMGIKALEKQIPQLVANDGMRIPFSYYCPNCKEELSDDGYKDEEIKYCPSCGQAIDWSDENDRED